MSSRIRRAVALTTVGLLVSGGLWAPAFLSWEATGFGDWQQFHHWWEVGVVSLRRWGEWPLWDPHHCGGVNHWGQPQNQNFSLLYLVFAVPLGTTLGHKLWALAHTAIGWSGCYVLARQEERLSRAGAFMAALLFCVNGFQAWHGAGGHSTYFAFLYYPWLLVCWRRAHRDPRWIAAVAAIMTELLLEGGHYPFPYAAVVLGFDSVVTAFRGQLLATTRTILIGGVLTLVMGAMRWVPILIAMSRHPRPIEDTDALTFGEIVYMWTARSHGWTFPGHPWVWPEYGTYVGWGVLAVTTVGAVFALVQWRRYLPLVLGFLLFLGFSMGNVAWYWPSPLLHNLPFFSNLHVPSRWQVVCLLYMGLLVGLAITVAERALPARHWGADLEWVRPLLPWVVVVALGADLYVVALSVTDRWDGAPIGVHRVESPHLVYPGRYHEEYANYPSRNVGTSECYDAVPWPKSRYLRSGRVPQVEIVPLPEQAHRSTAGDRLIGYDRTNHRAWAEVELGSPGRVVFNQNYEMQWESSHGTPVDDGRGRLAVDVPEGHHRVEVWFAPDDLPYSVIASVIGWLGALALWVGPRLLRRRRLAASQRGTPPARSTV